MKKTGKNKKIATILILFFLALWGMGYTAWLSFQPGFQIGFNRDVPSNLPPEELAKALDDLTQWPLYFKALKDVKMEDSTGLVLPPEYQKLMTNLNIRLFVEPVQKEWKRYELLGKIREYIPGKKIHIQLLKDSTNKLAKVFDSLDWVISIEPATKELSDKGFKSIAHGDASAITKNLRGKFLGKLAPGILMNQAFLADLVKLGTIDKQRESKKDGVGPEYQ